MTVIKRPVRRLFNSSSIRRGLIVTLDPAGYIRFREKSSRREYSMSVEYCYFMAVKVGKQTKGDDNDDKWIR